MRGLVAGALLLQASPCAPAMLKLRITEGNDAGRSYSFHAQQVAVGRTAGDLSLNDPSVSARHARLLATSEGWFLEDLGSTNGTFLNERPVQQATMVRRGDIIRLGDTVLQIEETRLDGQAQRPNTLGWSLSELQDGRPRLIGRSPTVDLRLDEPVVSRRHASLVWQGGGVLLTDCGSTNGTFVNGRRISSAVLQSGDLIRIGSTEFRWGGSGMAVAQGKGPIRLDVCGLGHTVAYRGSARTLLDGVDFTVEPGEFIAIVGGSGTGKTSLFRVLAGLETPTIGAVRLNGTDFHAHHEQFAGQVGFVPQDDIVHPELAVQTALMYAARLRLPMDTSNTECAERVVSVLEAVSLSHRAESEIRLLSGGERKRVNVALELLSEPNLLYLDEPTSGLDPHREEQMMELLRSISKQGRTVVVTTHSTLSLGMCDLLLAMGSGGQMVYYGPPHEIQRHFGCSNYQGIYTAIGETPESALKWQRRYWGCRLHQEYGSARRRHREEGGDRPGSVTAGAYRIGASAWLHQFSLLAQRYLAVLVSDRTNAAMLLAQAPLIVLIMLLVFRSNTFEAVANTDGTTPLRHASPVLFLLALSAIWFGTSNSVREIVKERPIFIRERLAFLKPSAYFWSKFMVLASLCVVQCAVLVGGVGAWMHWFRVSDSAVLEMLGTMVLASFVGLGMGLALSTLVRSSDQAVSLMPMVLLPQIIFSGLFFTAESPGGIVDLFSEIHASHWTYSALGRLADINGKLGQATDDLTRRLAEKQMAVGMHEPSVVAKPFSLVEAFRSDLGASLFALLAILAATIGVALIGVSRKRSR